MHASANLDGVIGFQSENNKFSADGAEAFAPYSKTSQNAVFAYEEYATSWGKLSFGGRLESVKVESLGNPLVARFAPLTRDFTPHSYALGALWNAAPGWQVTSNLAYTETRAQRLRNSSPRARTWRPRPGKPATPRWARKSRPAWTWARPGSPAPTASAPTPMCTALKNYIGLLATGKHLWAGRRRAQPGRRGRRRRGRCQPGQRHPSGVLPTPACAPALWAWRPAAISA